MDRLKIAQYIAIAATVISVIGILMGRIYGSELGDVFMMMSFFVRVVSFLFGGFRVVIKMFDSVKVQCSRMMTFAGNMYSVEDGSLYRVPFIHAEEYEL